MKPFSIVGDCLQWQMKHELLRIEPWGKDSLRVRATRGQEIMELPGALLEPVPNKVEIHIDESGATIQNGNLQAEMMSDGHLIFRNVRTDKVVLEEEELNWAFPPAREYKSQSSDLYHIEVKFKARLDERFYGLGQHRHGFLNQKGCVIELVQRNSLVSIPFMISNVKYGFLWNNPAIGRVELGRERTRWVSESARQIDYYLTIGDTYEEIMAHYADATGHPPVFPDWAAGFWQSKMRYSDQAELMSVAREYKNRGLPLSTIFIDWFHWPTGFGDWKFDLRYWPDPAGMVRELEDMGVKVVVNIWPTVNPSNPNYEEMVQKGLLVRTERGLSPLVVFRDVNTDGPVYLHYSDATNPEARQYLWQKIKQGYYQYGIKTWFLDVCEPELYPMDHEHLHYHLGNGLEVSNLYPLLHQQGFYEGMQAERETEFITLCRSAWAGSQRYAAAIWSGDIPSTFESLRVQVQAGMNMGLSGIPWWTTDIGGTGVGDRTTGYFKELIVRWFQYGVYCPLFRLHCGMLPMLPGFVFKGSPNEIWTYGDEAYQIIRELLFLREKMRPYLLKQMTQAHEKGTPPMRPLFFDFEDDPTCYEVEDQFMLGKDILIAPIVLEGARQKDVYLPCGTDWVDSRTLKTLKGGKWITADAPLEAIPVYYRLGSQPFFDTNL
jgi:alpha-D-xyloside xylohydrolase